MACICVSTSFPLIKVDAPTELRFPSKFLPLSCNFDQKQNTISWKCNISTSSIPFLPIVLPPRPNSVQKRRSSNVVCGSSSLTDKAMEDFFVCVECSEAFNYRSQLILHYQQQHADIMTIDCLECRCGNFFGTKEEYAAHFTLCRLVRDGVQYSISQIKNIKTEEYKAERRAERLEKDGTIVDGGSGRRRKGKRGGRRGWGGGGRREKRTKGGRSGGRRGRRGH